MLRAVSQVKLQAHSAQAVCTNTHTLVLRSNQESSVAVAVGAALDGVLSLSTSTLPGNFVPLTVNGLHFKISLVPGL